MKTLDTLVPDMLRVLEGYGSWDEAVTAFLSEGIAGVAYERFRKPQEPRKYLGLSQLGSPCKRKLWYTVNEPEQSESLDAKVLGTFFYGDMVEVLALALAKAAGHDVQGEQDRLDVHGFKGHRDAVIDGVTVDVKSTSGYGFNKFKNGKLREDDPFGYISQLSSYVYAGRDDPLVRNKHEGAFLAISKDRFDLCLDRYDFTKEIQTKESEIASIKESVSQASPDGAGNRIPPVPVTTGRDKKPNGNFRLDTLCRYCQFKKRCYPEARVFSYSNGDRLDYLTKVVKTPNVPEIIE